MPFVAVKCPSCAGNIQLDSSNESGYCVYCGSKVIYKEAVQKMQLSGEISVKGIVDLEKLFKNAEMFHLLGNYQKETEILVRITNDYPEDYRGWWRLASQEMNLYNSSENVYGEADPYRFTNLEYNVIVGGKSVRSNIQNAIRLVDPKNGHEIKEKAKGYHLSWLKFYQHEKEKLEKHKEYMCLRNDIFLTSRAKAHAETELTAGLSATTKTDNAMARIAVRLIFAILLAGSDLYLLFFLFSHAINGTVIWLLMIISTQIIYFFMFRKVIGKKPEVKKPFRQNYYSFFYESEMQKQEDNQTSLCHKYEEQLLAAASINKDVYQEWPSKYLYDQNKNTAFTQALSYCDQKIQYISDFICAIDEQKKQNSEKMEE